MNKIDFKDTTKSYFLIENDWVTEYRMMGVKGRYDYFYMLNISLDKPIRFYKDEVEKMYGSYNEALEGLRDKHERWIRFINKMLNREKDPNDNEQE